MNSYDSVDLRAQLSINLKVLYGPNIEVLTLSSRDQCQALAIGFDPFVTTGTKFLHSEISSSSAVAIKNLLENSERELTKLFLAGGIAVPFEGEKNEVQNLTLPTRQDRRGSAGSGSLREEFELVDTPGSSLVDENGPREFLDDLTRGSAPVDEVVEIIDEDMSKKVLDVVEEPLKIDIIPAQEPVPNEASIIEFEELAPISKPKKYKQKSKKVTDDPQLVPEEAPVDDFGSGGSSWQVTESKIVFNEPTIVEEASIPGPEPEPMVEGSFGLRSPKSKKDKKKKCKASIADYLPPVPDPPVAEVFMVEDAPIPDSEPPVQVCDSGWDSFAPIKKDKKGKKGKKTIGLEEPVVIEQLPAMDEPIPDPPLDDSPWGSLLFSPAKKEKRKKKCDAFVEGPVIDEEVVVPNPEPQLESKADDWGPLPKKSKKKISKARFEEAKGPDILEPEPKVDPWSFGILKKDKKKGRVIAEEDRPAEECVVVACAAEECHIADEAVIPDPEPELDPWSLGALKRKDKKKKSKAVWDEILIEELPTEPGLEMETIIEEPTKELGLEPAEVVEYESWMQWTQRKEETRENEEEKKNLATLEDVEQYLKSHVLAEPAVEDEPRIDHEPIQPLEPEPKPISDDDGWGSWTATAKNKKKGKKSKVDDELSQPSEPAPAIDHDIPDQHVEAPLASEPKDQSTSTPPPSGSTPSPNMNHTSRIKATKKGGPVVFTIRYANDPDHKPEQVITRLIENSYEGIIETVNLHLDSKSFSKDSHAPRKVEIKSSFGRNGEVDVSELEESRWPQYLEYFCQFTRNIAELTVEIVD